MHDKHCHCLPHAKLVDHTPEAFRFCQLPDYHCDLSLHGHGVPKTEVLVLEQGDELEAKVHEHAMEDSEILSPLLTMPGPKHELLSPV